MNLQTINSTLVGDWYGRCPEEERKFASPTFFSSGILRTPFR